MPPGTSETRQTVWDLLTASPDGDDDRPWAAHCMDGSYDDGDRIRLGDPETRSYVVLSRFMERYIVAEVFAPDLSEDREGRLQALGWRLESTGTSPIMPTWTIGWKWYEGDKAFLAEQARSVVAALRDVLSVPEERVRCWAWGEGGPMGVWHLRHLDERPTSWGAAPRCTGWDDLRRRLDWVLQTLPTNAALLLMHPETNATVQFMTDFKSSMVNSALDPGLDPAALPEPGGEATGHERRMMEIGWTPRRHHAGMADWTLGEQETWADVGPLAAQAVDALRELGCGSPGELRFRTFRHGTAEDPGYIEAELGVRPE